VLLLQASEKLFTVDIAGNQIHRNIEINCLQVIENVCVLVNDRQTVGRTDGPII